MSAWQGLGTYAGLEGKRAGSHVVGFVVSVLRVGGWTEARLLEALLGSWADWIHCTGWSTDDPPWIIFIWVELG